MITRIKRRKGPLILALCSLFWVKVTAQQLKIEESFFLSDSLHEISGLVYWKNHLIAHNDSGDQAILYVLNLRGEITKTVQLRNATNRDWEDLALDEKTGTLFIGDIGNNGNQRKDLCIYRVSADSVIASKEVTAEKIRFRYADQQAYPPENKDLHFDAEAMIYLNDSLWIFTKCRSKPYDGLSYVYKLSLESDNQSAEVFQRLDLGGKRTNRHAVTGACKDGDKIFLLTYKGIFALKRDGGRSFAEEKYIKFKNWTQKEAIVHVENGFFLSDEKAPILGGGKLYRMRIK
ncbi:MAG: hypothetical protein EP338_00585 [Bacteroidetes bacterium]|nr:MAG: hypothetical protein EP338_00585 [Bacteroidota bacterium]